MKRALIIIIFIISVISFIVPKPTWAEDKLAYLQGVEFLTGFGQGELIRKQDYRLIPVMVAFDFNIKSFTKKIGFNPPSLVQFQLEPFLSLAIQPETNMEVGASFLFKFGLLPESWKFQPYVKVGTGIIHMTQHTNDQSTQFNFLTSGGFGFHYFFNPPRFASNPTSSQERRGVSSDTAFTLEYRFRHLSNASMKQPNSGIDVHFGLFGITYLF